MNDLAGHRCMNHPDREAVAVCPECKRFFCRECVTEHEDRVLCASCLSAGLQHPEKRRFSFGGVVGFAGCCFGLLLLWILFYSLGQLLISIPSSFHEGAVWKEALDMIK